MLIRFKEWKEYVKYQSEVNTNHDTCMIVLTFNQLNAVKQNIDFFKSQASDLLIVDNNSSDGTFDFLKEEAEHKFNFLATTQNLGGAGGFAIGMEWVLSKGYKYIIVTEEDAFPMDMNIVDKLLEQREARTIVRSHYYDINNLSLAFHFTLYSTDIIKDAGVVNYTYFFRSDDWEFYNRLFKVAQLKKQPISLKTIPQQYTHPFKKPGFKVWTNYFDIRNALRSYALFPVKGSLADMNKLLLNSFLTAYSALFQKGNAQLLLLTLKAIQHHLQGKYSIKANTEALKSFHRFELVPEKASDLRSESLKSFLMHRTTLFSLRPFSHISILKHLQC
jgi:glycosyltransferase involved in cell wall biosynthesis